jgi:hypothetical protein
MTRTDLFPVVKSEVLEKMLAAMPRSRPLETNEVGESVSFVASSAGDGASGNVTFLKQDRDVR